MNAMTKISITIVAVLMAFGSIGQSKKELLELGDQAFEKKNYASAAYFYLKIVQGSKGGKYDVAHPYEINTYTTGKTNVDTSQTVALSVSEARNQHSINRIADSYRLLHDYENAVVWYEKALTNPSEEFPYARYWYASSLIKLERYDEADAEINKFMEEVDDNDPFKQLALNRQISCTFATNPENQTEDVVTKMDSIFNNGTSSFAVQFYEGELSLMFTSARSNSKVDDPKKQNPMYHADIFRTQNVGNGWEPATPMQGEITSAAHEGSSCLSVDRSTFYFTRWDDADKNNCHIYVSKKFNNQWMIPLKLNTVNVDGYRSMNPYLSLDEETIYFVSDMPGGQGGLDIWAAPIDENANIGTPYNLGPVVNTPEDEMSPFHHFQTNTLYFSSEGHIGFGGLDVFRTKYVEDNGSWTTPINMGSPINSSKDDSYYIIDKSQKYGYFSSDRERCESCDSLSPIKGYCDKIYKVERPELEFSINGFVFNAETNEPIPNALITFKDIKGGFAPFFVMTNSEGYYEKELEPGMDMFMKAQKTGYFGDAATQSTSGLTVSTVLMQDFFLNPIPQEAIEIAGIEYDFDKATLRPKSKEILDELVTFLNLNDNLTIEIQSHTDFRGDDNYNLQLSKDRAQSVVDYLVDAGISRSRLKPKGYGEKEPAVRLDENKKPIKNADGEFERLTPAYINGLTSELERNKAHQRNRRTAFKVLSEDNEVLQESANQ